MGRLEEVRRRDKNWSGTFRQTHWDRRYILAKLDAAVGLLREPNDAMPLNDFRDWQVRRADFLRSLDTDQEGVEG